jgi:hypothetical protein
MQQGDTIYDQAVFSAGEKVTPMDLTSFRRDSSTVSFNWGLLTPSMTRLSNIQILTSFPVVLCVPLKTFHNPTEKGFRLDPDGIAETLDVDELGVEVDVEWMV